MASITRSNVYNIPAEDLIILPEENSRVKLPDLQETMTSILKYGVIQPVPVRGALKDEFEGIEKGSRIVIAGHCRTAAAKELASKGRYSEKFDGTVPCIVHQEVDRKLQFLLNLEENCVRNDLTPADTIRAIGKLEEFGIVDLKDQAECFHKSESWVREHKKISGGLAPELQPLIETPREEGGIGWATAAQLAKMPPEEQGKAVEELREKGEPITRENVQERRRASSTDEDEDEEEGKEGKDKKPGRTAAQMRKYWEGLVLSEPTQSAIYLLARYMLRFHDGVKEGTMDANLRKLLDKVKL